MARSIGNNGSWGATRRNRNSTTEKLATKLKIERQRNINRVVNKETSRSPVWSKLDSYRKQNIQDYIKDRTIVPLDEIAGGGARPFDSFFITIFNLTGSSVSGSLSLNGGFVGEFNISPNRYKTWRWRTEGQKRKEDNIYYNNKYLDFPYVDNTELADSLMWYEGLWYSWSSFEFNQSTSLPGCHGFPQGTTQEITRATQPKAYKRFGLLNDPVDLDTTNGNNFYYRDSDLILGSGWRTTDLLFKDTEQEKVAGEPYTPWWGNGMMLYHGPDGIYDIANYGPDWWFDEPDIYDQLLYEYDSGEGVNTIEVSYSAAASEFGDEGVLMYHGNFDYPGVQTATNSGPVCDPDIDHMTPYFHGIGQHVDGYYYLDPAESYLQVKAFGFCAWNNHAETCLYFGIRDKLLFDIGPNKGEYFVQGTNCFGGTRPGVAWEHPIYDIEQYIPFDADLDLWIVELDECLEASLGYVPNDYGSLNAEDKKILYTCVKKTAKKLAKNLYEKYPFYAMSTSDQRDYTDGFLSYPGIKHIDISLKNTPLPGNAQCSSDYSC